MTIEESVKKNPEVFEKIMKGKKEDLVYAFKDLAQKLDIIIWAAMAEYRFYKTEDDAKSE